MKQRFKKTLDYENHLIEFDFSDHAIISGKEEKIVIALPERGDYNQLVDIAVR